MTDRKFLKRMIFLTKEICHIYNNETIDQVALQAILDEVQKVGAKLNRSRRHRSMLFGAFIAFLLFLLALYVGYILIDVKI